MSKHDQAMKDINVIAEKLTITQSLELSKMISTIRNYINDMEALQNELEELKRDLFLYFELADNDEITEEVLYEFSKIRNKLMKVGKE